MVSIIDRVRGRTDAPVLPEPEPEDIFEEMTLQEHLEELRQRILYSSIAIAIAFVIGLLLAFPLLGVMADFSGLETFVLISPTEGFSTFMRVGFYIAVALAMPVLMYQLIAFMGPGMTSEERYYVRLALIPVTILFVAGMAFAFFIVVPRALNFLAGFGAGGYGPVVFEDAFRASEILSFYFRLMLWIGLVFQMPVVIFVLVKLGIVSTERLASIRKFMLIGCMIAAAIITPTPDPFNMLLVAIPMYLLYELGLLLSRFSIGWVATPEAGAGPDPDESDETRR
ncbi:MAG: twin-arginine translocase subunit TatC [Sphaerobacteraceae bacterium]|nr:MAG: twin-arginine translocase subunit TatC [Sphaerobacteraceae bacterium]